MRDVRHPVLPSRVCDRPNWRRMGPGVPLDPAARGPYPLLRRSHSQHDEPGRLPSWRSLHQAERWATHLLLAGGTGVDSFTARPKERRVMASFYIKDAYLYVDFRWRGVRCQEATRLADTTENRAKVRRDIRQIDGEIAAGTFEYIRWFPHGRRAALFAPTESNGPPLYREYVQRW